MGHMITFCSLLHHLHMPLIKHHKLFKLQRTIMGPIFNLRAFVTTIWIIFFTSKGLKKSSKLLSSLCSYYATLFMGMMGLHPSFGEFTALNFVQHVTKNRHWCCQNIWVLNIIIILIIITSNICHSFIFLFLSLPFFCH